MQFLFVGSNFCRQLLSDSTSRWTPLLLANASDCNGAFRTFTLELIYMPNIQKGIVETIPALLYENA